MKNKKKNKDVVLFSLHLMDNLNHLYSELSSRKYRHGKYEHFIVVDPKRRDIHKSQVRDRVVHHLVYNFLYSYFDQKFIYDSYSCRNNKGTHRALIRFKTFARKVSRNNTKTCYVLKCDIKKFFSNIDHEILKRLLRKHIFDDNLRCLVEDIIDSFHSKEKQGVGLPLGNLTSQLLVNVYMNEFDQFVKHELREKYYIRYADDFVFFSGIKSHLEEIIPNIKKFLTQYLKLELHPNKIEIKTIASGVDFLGWVHFSYYRKIRKITHKRMLQRLRITKNNHVLSSYLGLLKYGNTWKIQKDLLYF